MQTIQTKYIPATDRTPSRIKATASRGASVTIPYGSDDSYIHYRAIALLARQLKWTYSSLVIGDIKGGKVAVMLIDTIIDTTRGETTYLSQDTKHNCWDKLELD
jgi:hypothetical protein